MSIAPYTLSGIRWGTRYGVDQKLEDSLAASLVDQVTGTPGSWKPTPMGGTEYNIFERLLVIQIYSTVTAENLAEKYGISREDSDRFSLLSQERWAKAQADGAFKAEITPIEIKTKKGTEIFEVDEHPRQTTIETLTKLSPVFKKGGTVTAGSASGIGDGAAANVVMSGEALEKYGVKPLARIVSYGIAAVEPHLMGIAPVGAVRTALQRASLKIDDIDIIELNEVSSSLV
jgi:acetyl-CoA acyltransferase 2